MAATLNRQWRLNGFTGFDSLVLKEDGIPEVGDLDVLVRWNYASLNYRDLVVSKVFQNKPQSSAEFATDKPSGYISSRSSRWRCCRL